MPPELATLPERVLLCEVGPRDGFQYESRVIPTALKVKIIRRLIHAGVRRIQAVSFVHPGWVPQMADAEDVLEALPPVPEDVTIAGLVLNLRGVERAARAGLAHVDISIATHDAHSLENANMTVLDAVREAERMSVRAQEAGMSVQMGLQTVFGFREPGDTALARVLELVRAFNEWGVEEISLADSTGMANPVSIRETVAAVRDQVPEAPLVLHLHDTRGLGLANIMEALVQGVTRFDTSFGGMGGCPFIEGATGNVATEDTVYLLHALGVRTDIQIEAVAGCSRDMESFLGHLLPGKMHRVLASAGHASGEH